MDEKKEHLWNEYVRLLPEIIKEFGIANTVAGLSNEVDDMLDKAEENIDSTYNKACDLEFASLVLEAAVIGTDLCYGRSFYASGRDVRKEAKLGMLDVIENIEV